MFHWVEMHVKTSGIMIMQPSTTNYDKNAGFSRPFGIRWATFFKTLGGLMFIVLYKFVYLELDLSRKDREKWIYSMRID